MKDFCRDGDSIAKLSWCMSDSTVSLNRRGKSWPSQEDTQASSTLSNVSQPHFQTIFLEQNFLQILLKTFFCSNKNINLRGEWKMWKKKNSA